MRINPIKIYVVTTTHNYFFLLVDAYATLEEAQKRFDELRDYYQSIHQSENKKAEETDALWSDFENWTSAFNTELQTIKALKMGLNQFGSRTKVVNSTIIYLSKHTII